MPVGRWCSILCPPPRSFEEFLKCRDIARVNSKMLVSLAPIIDGFEECLLLKTLNEVVEAL
ncbi:MAG: hypothetical protein ACE1ZD_00625 [Dehalococcoidia bacterium]